MISLLNGCLGVEVSSVLLPKRLRGAEICYEVRVCGLQLSVSRTSVGREAVHGGHVKAIAICDVRPTV